MVDYLIRELKEHLEDNPMKICLGTIYIYIGRLIILIHLDLFRYEIEQDKEFQVYYLLIFVLFRKDSKQIKTKE